MLCLQRLGGDLNCRFLPWSDGWIWWSWQDAGKGLKGEIKGKGKDKGGKASCSLHSRVSQSCFSPEVHVIFECDLIDFSHAAGLSIFLLWCAHTHIRTYICVHMLTYACRHSHGWVKKEDLKPHISPSSPLRLPIPSWSAWSAWSAPWPGFANVTWPQTDSLSLSLSEFYVNIYTHTSYNIMMQSFIHKTGGTHQLCSFIAIEFYWILTGWKRRRWQGLVKSASALSVRGREMAFCDILLHLWRRRNSCRLPKERKESDGPRVAVTDWNLWGHSNSLGTINAILFLTNLTELLKIFCQG